MRHLATVQFLASDRLQLDKLVQILATSRSSTIARYLDILDGEFIVIRQLLSFVDLTTGEDHDVFLAVDLNDPGETIGLQEK